VSSSTSSNSLIVFSDCVFVVARTGLDILGQYFLRFLNGVGYALPRLHSAATRTDGENGFKGGQFRVAATPVAGTNFRFARWLTPGPASHASKGQERSTGMAGRDQLHTSRGREPWLPRLRADRPAAGPLPQASTGVYPIARNEEKRGRRRLVGEPIEAGVWPPPMGTREGCKHCPLRRTPCQSIILKLQTA
jgi:hypothetical protein